MCARAQVPEKDIQAAKLSPLQEQYALLTTESSLWLFLFFRPSPLVIILFCSPSWPSIQTKPSTLPTQVPGITGVTHAWLWHYFWIMYYPVSFKKKKKKSQLGLVECLPSVHEGLSSNKSSHCWSWGRRIRSSGLPWLSSWTAWGTTASQVWAKSLIPAWRRQGNGGT